MIEKYISQHMGVKAYQLLYITIVCRYNVKKEGDNNLLSRRTASDGGSNLIITGIKHTFVLVKLWCSRQRSTVTLFKFWRRFSIGIYTTELILLSILQDFVGNKLSRNVDINLSGRGLLLPPTAKELDLNR